MSVSSIWPINLGIKIVVVKTHFIEVMLLNLLNLCHLLKWGPLLCLYYQHQEVKQSQWCHKLGEQPVTTIIVIQTIKINSITAALPK